MEDDNITMTLTKKENLSLASLPMYDCFLTNEMNDTYWNEIKMYLSNENIEFPKELNNLYSSHKIWTSGSLLTLTQTCGYPLVQEYYKYMKILGTPIYNAPGCDNAYYTSAIITSTKFKESSLDSFLQNHNNIKLSINSTSSCSGWLMFLSTISNNNNVKNIKKIIITGSHIGSIKTIQNNFADLSCIDCVSFELARRYCPELLSNIKIIGWTLPALSLPYTTDINASDKKIKIIQNGLKKVIENNNINTITARENHLIVDFDMNKDINHYRLSIQSHIDKIKENEYLFNIFNIMKPNTSLMELRTIDHGFQIDLLSNMQDSIWPITDFQFLNYLKLYIIHYLWNVINEECLSMCSNQLELINYEYIALYLTSTLLLNILESKVIRRQIWSLLPNGDKAKLIFCTVEGTLILMLDIYQSSILQQQQQEDEEIVNEDTAKDNRNDHIHKSWNIISKIAKETLCLYLTNSNNSDLLLRYQCILNSNNNDITDDNNNNNNKCADPYFAGFMGAAAKALYEVPINQNNDSGIKKDSNHNNDDTNHSNDSFNESIHEKLWDADIQLSSYLIKVASSIGIYVYISAPIHNDRNDWGNLVIGQNEESILKWRDSQHHLSVRTHIAPYCYDHIRLHRGILENGIAGSKMLLLRSLFLSPTSNTNHNNLHNSNRLVDHVHNNNKIDEFVKSKEIINTKIFEKHLIYWDNVPNNNNNIENHDININNLDLYNKYVPGGANVCIGEFKKILNSNQAKYVYTL